MIVSHFNGTIGFESVYSKGSTFWFTLELADPCLILERKMSKHLRKSSLKIDNCSNKQSLSDESSDYDSEFDVS